MQLWFLETQLRLILENVHERKDNA